MTQLITFGRACAVVPESLRAQLRDDHATVQENSKVFARKVDAQTWLGRQTAAVVTGLPASPTAGRVTVDVVAKAWLAGHPSWEEATRSRYASIVKRHILPKWGVFGLLTWWRCTTRFRRGSLSGAGWWVVRPVDGAEEPRRAVADL
ncbi:hypothetical protein [Nocardia sp. NPDC058497]|uniref:hypothetical protein n=1 Tax=Nocardia sp. NPDC058497 TaxID=3346529 RepID=UPI003656D4A4